MTGHLPSATYRLQLAPAFGFAEVQRLLPYLARLGVSHLYLSPAFAARPGSTHGYDVVDMTRLNPELGGREGFEQLSAAMQQSGLGWLQDVVPNHCAFHGANAQLMDVLELGPHSRFYNFYDILWDHPYENIKGKILAPFLGDFYARCLERGELSLRYCEQGLRVSYYDVELPISLHSYQQVLRHDLIKLTSGPPTANLPRLLALIKFIGNLEQEIAAGPDFDFPCFIKQILWELYQEDGVIRAHLDRTIAAFNQRQPAGFDLLDGLLGEQFFRLSYWKVGTEELNYRRFFSINDLISLRMEEPEVMEHTHALLFELIESGKVQGVRIDHVDGLYDPAAYLFQLRRRFPELYVVVEKILGPEEALPDDWPVQGTTGYDFLDQVGALLHDPTAEREIRRCCRAFSNVKQPYGDIVAQNKRKIVRRHMAGDIDNLALLLKGITNRSREGNDLTMYGVRQALVEVLIQFPIYRTYLSRAGCSARDLELLRRVFQRAQRAAPHFRNELELIGGAIARLGDERPQGPEQREWLQLVMRLQQFTGPLMAKGVEDSAFYVYNALVSRNDVGCEPMRLATSVDAFHGFNLRRAQSWPHAMSATATHDTKRGEDTRARIATISWDVALWRDNLGRWSKLNRRHKRRVDGRLCPVANDELLIYQTVIGAAPMAGLQADDFPRRLEHYLVKAAREGKRETSWLEPDERYEAALLRFARRILSPETGADFLQQLMPYLERVTHWGIFASLTQTLLKLSCPGVPDLYQGTELWDLSLVDPDNRRSVDFELRQQLLGQLLKGLQQDRAGLLAEVCRSPADGRIKLLLTHQLLQLRRERRELFQQGRYQPLALSGPQADALVAFARVAGEHALVVLTPRQVNQLQPRAPGVTIDAEAWGETRLWLPRGPGKGWRDRLTGTRHPAEQELPVAHLLPGPLPFALLTSW